MSPRAPSIVVVGAGVFGVSAALAFRRRGYAVTLCDPGPLPHPDASSTDISKAIRMDYGSDLLYTEMAEASIEGWCRWNAEWDEPLYHADGFLLMTHEPMVPGTFEHDGYTSLAERGQPVRRMQAPALAEGFPAWNAGLYLDGYFNVNGGWVESGRVVEWAVRRAATAGVLLREGLRASGLVERNGGVVGVELEDGSEIRADRTLVAAGVWTPILLPWLADRLQVVGQPVMHFRPSDPDEFRGEVFPVWGADISRTGWYGFPLSPGGVVKVGHHGDGVALHPDAPRKIPDRHEDRCRQFLAGTFPTLADAPVVATRLCPYCDSFDGNFFIGRDPDRPGLSVAAGGSGHGFKFAPVIGDLIADVTEEIDHPWAARFSWREAGERSFEQARFSSSGDRD